MRNILRFLVHFAVLTLAAALLQWIVCYLAGGIVFYASPVVLVLHSLIMASSVVFYTVNVRMNRVHDYFVTFLLLCPWMVVEIVIFRGIFFVPK